jgi:hypothetical protein
LIASSAELAGITCFCLIVAPWRDDGPENLPCRDHTICLRGADGVQFIPAQIGGALLGSWFWGWLFADEAKR